MRSPIPDSTSYVPFNWPYMAGTELLYISEAYFQARQGKTDCFTRKCTEWLEKTTGAPKALLTHSCTSALELATLALGLKRGDEVIMPSFTFVSTANAVVLRGAVPVFVDIREDTLNLDEKRIEEAITPRTRAILPVHYAGVACAMDEILDIAGRHDLAVVEDAAQAILSTYKGKPVGTHGGLAALSFHETKNVSSGEGGVLLVNDDSLLERVQLLAAMGAEDRVWEEAGAAFLSGEYIAAFLWAQMERAEEITEARLRAWNLYHELLGSLESAGKLRRPIVPSECRHNAHLYYVLANSADEQVRIIERLNSLGINVVFHYVPLHSAPAGMRFGRAVGDLGVTDALSARLIRLPLWMGISEEQQVRVVDVLSEALGVGG